MDIEGALERASEALGSGRTLKGTGFWKAVAALRADRALAERYADRAAAIDRRAFEAGVRLRVPAGPGLAALWLGTIVGLVAMNIGFWWWGGPLCGFDNPCSPTPIAAALVFLAGLTALIVCTHCLAHWVVGRVVGIRFTHVFLGGPPPPRPGLKTDYSTYLRASPRARAAMHASGAIITKLIPFAVLAPLHWYFGWNWLTLLILVVGVVQVVTDIVLSTKVSDWMKVRRELRAAPTWNGRSTS